MGGNILNLVSQSMRNGLSNIDMGLLDIILLEWLINHYLKSSSEAGQINTLKMYCLLTEWVVEDSKNWQKKRNY